MPYDLKDHADETLSNVMRLFDSSAGISMPSPSPTYDMALAMQIASRAWLDNQFAREASSPELFRQEVMQVPTHGLRPTQHLQDPVRQEVPHDNSASTSGVYVGREASRGRHGELRLELQHLDGSVRNTQVTRGAGWSLFDAVSHYRIRFVTPLDEQAAAQSIDALRLRTTEAAADLIARNSSPVVCSGEGFQASHARGHIPDRNGDVWGASEYTPRVQLVNPTFAEQAATVTAPTGHRLLLSTFQEICTHMASGRIPAGVYTPADVQAVRDTINLLAARELITIPDGVWVDTDNNSDDDMPAPPPPVVPVPTTPSAIQEVLTSPTGNSRRVRKLQPQKRPPEDPAAT